MQINQSDSTKAREHQSLINPGAVHSEFVPTGLGVCRLMASDGQVGARSVRLCGASGGYIRSCDCLVYLHLVDDQKRDGMAAPLAASGARSFSCSSRSCSSSTASAG